MCTLSTWNKFEDEFCFRSMFSQRIYFVILFSFIFLFNSNLINAKDLSKVDLRLSEMQAKYELAFYLRVLPKFTWGEKVQFQKIETADEKQLMGYLELLAKELDKYPLEFFKKANLKGIALTKSLAFDGQSRAGIPDYFKEILILDVFAGGFYVAYQQHVIHHEFYHMLEQEWNGDPFYKDPKWVKINKRKFQYGSGGASMRDGKSYLLTNPIKGFINTYSLSGLEEDKAEIYACLFIPSERMELMNFKRKDRILKRKVKYICGFLKKKHKGPKKTTWRQIIKKK